MDALYYSKCGFASKAVDKTSFFYVWSIGKLALCVKRKCAANYSVSGLWDGGCGFECSEIFHLR